MLLKSFCFIGNGIGETSIFTSCSSDDDENIRYILSKM